MQPPVASEAPAPQPRGRLRPPPRWVVAGASLAALLVSVAVTLSVGGPNTARWHLLARLAVSWAVFGLASWAVLRTPRRQALPILLLGAVGLQVVAVAFPPRWTDDYFRYAWDGRVQAAGIDPYRYPPVDPALARLRDDWLFPPSCRDAIPPCTRMNHPGSPTIYPPVAQATFVAVHVATVPLGRAGGRDRTWQVLGALLALATTLLLVGWLRARGDPRRAVLWAWCPTVVFECGNGGHIDALSTLLVAAALMAAVTGRTGRAGVALGAAVATKLLPVVVLPALLAPVPGLRDGIRGWRVWLARHRRLLAACAATLVAVYLPHAVAVGPRVFGFLPGYLSEEGYGDGHARFALLRLLLPPRLAAPAGVLLMVVLAVVVARRTDPRRPWSGALVLTGIGLAVAGITYPWYPLLLVVLVALDGRWEWLALAVPSYIGYFSVPLHLPFSTTERTGYGIALAAVLVVGLARSRSAPPSPAPHPASVTAGEVECVDGR